MDESSTHETNLGFMLILIIGAPSIEEISTTIKKKLEKSNGARFRRNGWILHRTLETKSPKNGCEKLQIVWKSGVKLNSNL